MKRVLRSNEKIPSLQSQGEIIYEFPEEIWKTIFAFTIERNQNSEEKKESDEKKPSETKPTVRNIQLSYQPLQIISCVNSDWKKIVHNVVVETFFQEKFHSDWLVSHFAHLIVHYDSTKRNLVSHITDKGFQCLTNLTNFNPPKTVTNSVFVGMTNLKTLRLINNTNVTDRGIQHLTSLTALDIVSTPRISSQSVSRMTNLTDLWVYKNNKIGDKSISNLKLHSLFLGNSKISNECVKGMTSLVALGVIGLTKIRDDAIMALTNLEGLCILSNRVKISNAAIQKLTNLKMLDLRRYKYANDDAFKNLTKLTTLYPPNEFSYEGLSNLSNLQILRWCLSRQIRDEHLMKLTSLTKLEIGLNLHITHNSLEKLTNLIVLNIHNFSNENANLIAKERIVENVKSLKVFLMDGECLIHQNCGCDL